MTLDGRVLYFMCCCHYAGFRNTSEGHKSVKVQNKGRKGLRDGDTKEAISRGVSNKLFPLVSVLMK
jgi:hypothetical protein